jgi:hypothetical protein
MKTAKIFLVGKNEDDLTPMVETDYETEDVLQTVLTRYPDLLPGDQIDPEDPRRWLLVAREMGVPGDVDEMGRWSLDHLFLDQNGRPTFVECKRAADVRTRREVVAQMLDYAANGTAYWSMDRLRQAAAETAEKRGKSLDDEIRKLLADDEADIESYWHTVEDNLRKGRVRLIFVTDRTPRELRRLVEFLNEKMTDVEVLAVEIKQFKGKEQRALVPRVVGFTEEAREKKEPSKLKIDRTTFLSQCPPNTVTTFSRILDLAEARGYTIYWGTKGLSVRAYLPKADRWISFAYCWPNGHFQFYFAQLPIPEGEAQAFRKQLMSYGIFAKSGEKTLDATLDAKAIAGLPEVYDVILTKMDEIVKAY